MAVVALLTVAASAGLAAPVGAADDVPPNLAQTVRESSPIDGALRRLQFAQNRDGGFGSKPGAPSDPVTSVWSALAMASVGINPADQPQTGTTILEYLVGTDDGEQPQHWRDLRSSSDLAAFLLVARAAAGPVAQARAKSAASTLVERVSRGGGVLERPGDKAADLRATALTILALAKDPDQSETARTTTAWLKKAFSSGGWGATSGAAPRPATTGLALQALWAVEPNENDLTSRAQAYLTDHANEDGGYGDAKASKSDPRSTAWVMQGLKAINVDPKSFAPGLGNVGPRTYLRRQQGIDGGFGDTLTTAQTLPGFNAVGFLLEPVPRGSALRSRSAIGERYKHGAAGGGPGGADDASGAKAGRGGSKPSSANDPDGAKGSDGPSGSAPSGDADGTPGTSTPSATPPASTPPPAATPAPTPTTPTPTPTTSTTPTSTTPRPADDTVASAGGKGDDEQDPPAASSTQQVNGVVVGARAAAASTGPSVAAGGGSSARDRGAAVLGGLIVALVLVGTQLERRRPRRVVS